MDHPVIPRVVKKHARTARLSLALLLAINLFNYIDRQVLASVEPNIRDQLVKTGGRFSPKTQTGFLTTAFLVSFMIMAPVFGCLADRISRWLLVGLAVIGWSLASGASGLAGVYGALLLTRLFVGVGEAAYGPAAPTILADLYPVQQRGRILAWFYMAIPVGGAIGYALGDLMNLWNPHSGWRWAFFSVVAPGLLLGCCCFLFKDPPRGQVETQRPARRARFADYKTLISTPSYVLDTLGMAAMTFAIGGISYWMPDYLDQRHATVPSWITHLPPKTFFGVIIAVGGLAATLMGGYVADLLRSRVRGAYFLVSGVGILLSVLFIFLMLIAPFPLAWLWVFLAVFCLFFNTGPSNTILANVTHPSVRATAFAVNIFIIHLLGDVPSPPLMGYLSDRFHGSWNPAFGLVCVLTTIGGILWLWGARYLDHDTEMSPHRIPGVALFHSH